MNKTVVIFQSKYGYTERYARWIGEALDCPVLKRKNCSAKTLATYDTILYGGGLYAGSVNGLKLLVRNRQLLSGKNVILFTCGLADPTDSENAARIRKALSRSVPPELLEKIRLFHLRGGMDYSGLSLAHRAMISMMRKMLLKKDENELSDEDRMLIDIYEKCIDFTNRESIAPLISFVSEITA